MIKSSKQLKTACNRDCPDACGIVATIEDGRVVRLQGDREHPVTQGFLCKRTSRYLQRQYHPSRITTPLIRSGSTWNTATLDQALDLIAERMLSFRDEFGPASIMNYRCGGSLGIMKAVTDYFFQEFGPVTIKSGDICAGAGDMAQLLDFGVADSNDFFDLQNSKTIFLWGKNVYVSHVHLLPLLKKCRAAGAKLVLIDPVRHRTTDLCDSFVQIEPGGDAALAFGMARWLSDQERLHPRASEYCDHFDKYLRLVHSRTCSEWAEQAGLSHDELVELAKCYSRGPTMVMAGWGMQRRPNGCAVIRAIDALAAVSGNIGIPGGGVSFYFARRSGFDLSFIDESIAPRAISEPLLGSGIEQATDPPIKMVWVSAANPVTTIPESKTVARALTDRFTVVVDSFMTDTAECADVFLPTTTMLEDDDLLGAYGHHWISESRPVIDAPAGVFTDYEILRRLAPRVGVGGWMADDTETWKRRLLGDLESQGITLESLRQQTVRNPKSGPIAFEGQRFQTDSGRANLIHEYEHPRARTDTHFPLRLMALSTDLAQSSQWDPETQIGPATLIVHPSSVPDLSEGDIVSLESELDSIQVKLEFDDNQRTDVALMEKGGWMSAGRCANILTRAESSDLGECAVYYDTPVRIVANNQS